MVDKPTIADFPFISTEKVRFSDTDRQQHVNNVLFAVFLEAGRIGILHTESDLAQLGAHFVIARSTIDFLGELNWPGHVTIGTRIERIGTSSFTLAQALFQNDICAAVSESVLVQVDVDTKRALPLSAAARTFLESPPSRS